MDGSDVFQLKIIATISSVYFYEESRDESLNKKCIINRLTHKRNRTLRVLKIPFNVGQRKIMYNSWHRLNVHV